MIVGKALKNNKELIDDEKKEIEFALKYQILSKNTALYAEIKNDYNDLNKNKLITVNLNDYIEEPVFGGAPPLIFAKKVRSFAGIKRHAIRADINANFIAAESLNNQVGCSYSLADSGLESIHNIKLEEEKKAESKDITKLIMSQNIIEGYWNENEETKQIINIIDKDKINKINKKIKSLNKGDKENNDKIKYTIIVIYYLNTKYSDKLNEYKLIINKAKKFLFNQGIIYEDIIKGI